MTEPLTQTEARRLAKRLSESTGLPHVAHTVPLGCWGGTERGWAVSGPAATQLTAGDALRAEQDAMRSQLIDDARSRLRQAEAAQDWRGQLDEIERLDYLGVDS